MLAGIGDPRRTRGIRHPFVAVLGVAVVATLAGAANYRMAIKPGPATDHGQQPPCATSHSA
ncbi:transposase family protein [Actinoallomurus sp. NPDC050550]|uniref:transposase family protein n=1 Tax=Actinoallomurus sp. NPDC050550 TaxID=3154937 RepID=UPI0033C1E311